MKTEISSKITKILVDKLGIKESEITAEASFTRDLGIDSLDYAELVMEFEQTFNIRIPDTDAEQLLTMQKAVDYISMKVSQV